MTAEGESWLERCQDIAQRVRTWVDMNCPPFQPIYIMIEEPINFKQSRAWSAAIQNRLFACILDELTTLKMNHKHTIIQTVRPATMKKLFTGNGFAKKEQVIQRACSMYKFKRHWNKLITETVADTIGIAYCCWLTFQNRIPYNGIIRL